MAGGAPQLREGAPAGAHEQDRRRALEVDIRGRVQPGEAVLCTSDALFGVRHGALAVLAVGHEPGEAGVLAITTRRLLFASERGGHLVIARDWIGSAMLRTTPDGRRDLRIVTAAGAAELHDVSTQVAAALAGTRAASVSVAAPARGPAHARAGALLRATALWWPHLLTALGALLWTILMLGARADRVGDLGLVSAVPGAAIAAVVLSCVGCAAALVRPQTSQRGRLVHVVVLVFVLYGAPHLISDVTSFNVAWRHAGVSSYVAQHGSVDPSINAYFNWPGFFALEAVAVQLAGLESALDLSRWTPLVFNLLYLPPLLLIGASASDERRFPYLVAGVFYVGNWVYQDYPSPQGLTFVLYLSVVAIVLCWLQRADDPEVQPQARAALMVVCFLAVLATVGTHQLTPFAMLAAIAALVLLRRCAFRALPAIILVLTVAWVVFAAGTYLNGHIDALKDQVGHVGATISSSVGGRVSGSTQHVLVTQLRLLTAAAAWLLALLAALLLLRRRARSFVPHVVLAAVPFSLVVLQAYGGEIVLRVYLFSLPFVAVLVASLVPRRAGRASVAAVGIFAAVAGGAFLVTRYGNLQIELFAPDEVRVVQRAYEIAPDGALLLAPNPQISWEFARLGEIRQRTIDGALQDLPTPPADLAQEVVRIAGASRTYVLITRNTRQYEALFGRPRWGTIAELERALSASPQFRRVYSNRGGTIFELRQQRAQGER